MLLKKIIIKLLQKLNGVLRKDNFKSVSPPFLWMGLFLSGDTDGPAFEDCDTW